MALFSLLREINPTQVTWAVKLRLIRVYERPTYGNNAEAFSLECIFHDSEGTRVHASIKKGLIQTYKPKLKEGSLYFVKNFIVADNKMAVKTNTFNYIIFFNNNTHCTEKIDNVPSILFKFAPFPVLPTIDDGQLIDVIGRIIVIHPLQQKEIRRRMVNQIEFTLEDLRANEVKCTLWDEYATQLNQFFETNYPDTAVIILQFCRVKSFKGEPNVSNTWNVTKLITDKEVKEINDFKNELPKDKANSIVVSHENSSSSTLTQLTSTSMVFRTLQKLQENEVGKFWITVRNVAIETVEDWYYVSCTKCPKKLKRSGQKLLSEKCNRYDKIGNLRYKLQIRVVEATGNVALLLWDRECQQLIGMTALEVKEKHDKRKNENNMPRELDAILNRKAIFLVHVKENQNEGPYSVIKITTDPDLVEKYESPNNDDSQDSDLLHRLEAPNSEEQVVSQCDEVVTPIQEKGREGNGENDDKVKRNLNGDLSSTSPIKKPRLRVKKEKLSM